MRIPATLALAAALAFPAVAAAQEALDPNPMAWHGVQLGPEQVFEGDYTIDYQTSVFRPDAPAAPEALWLSGWADRPGDGGGITRRYHLRFVGRQTVEPGKYGGLGAYRNEVLLARLLSSRLLIEKPEPDAKPPAEPAPKPKAKRRLKAH